MVTVGLMLCDKQDECTALEYAPRITQNSAAEKDHTWHDDSG